MNEGKRIAKNALFLYLRLFLVMVATLYTSRIVLGALGVKDYGIYNVIGGFVALLGFFNAAMTSATQRYLSFAIGGGDKDLLKKTFSASLSIHILLAISVFILVEIIGNWYIKQVMVFDIDRKQAVFYTLHFSALTFLLNIIQVPYNALIIAHEKMNIYALISIIEVILKLLGALLVVEIGFDKLILYSGVTFIVSLMIRLSYQLYCRKVFVESKFELLLDKLLYKEILFYSGWNLIGNFAFVARGQGINILLNTFFGPVVNAAYGVSNQVNSSVNMFMSNFLNAFNPQIVKSYAANNQDRALELIFYASKFSFFVMLIIILPLYFNLEFVLNTWLREVPVFTLDFLKITLFTLLIDSFSGPIMTLISATGKIKWYHIIIGGFMILCLPISYILLKLGFAAKIVFFVVMSMSILALFFRAIFLKKIISAFNIKKYVFHVLTKAGVVLGVSFGLFILINNLFLSFHGWNRFLISSSIIFVCTVILVVIIGLSNNEKKIFLSLIKRKR